MKSCVIIPLVSLCLPSVALADADKVHWSGAISLTTSSVINGMVTNKPEFGLSLNGGKGRAYWGARTTTASSGNGTDSQNSLFAGYNLPVKSFNVRYQFTHKAYPGTYDHLRDEGNIHQVSVSRTVKGTNYAVGMDYSDRDYTQVRKSYGASLSVSRGLTKKLSGWASVLHKHQVGAVDFTNVNVGLYYQLTPRIGVSTSVNNWHAYADWAEDRPTLSVALSRKL